MNIFRFLLISSLSLYLISCKTQKKEQLKPKQACDISQFGNYLVEIEVEENYPNTEKNIYTFKDTVIIKNNKIIAWKNQHITSAKCDLPISFESSSDDTKNLDISFCYFEYVWIRLQVVKLISVISKKNSFDINSKIQLSKIQFNDIKRDQILSGTGCNFSFSKKKFGNHKWQFITDFDEEALLNLGDEEIYLKHKPYHYGIPKNGKYYFENENYTVTIDIFSEGFQKYEMQKFNGTFKLTRKKDNQSVYKNLFGNCGNIDY